LEREKNFEGVTPLRGDSLLRSVTLTEAEGVVLTETTSTLDFTSGSARAVETFFSLCFILRNLLFSFLIISFLIFDIFSSSSSLACFCLFFLNLSYSFCFSFSLFSSA